MYRERMDAGLEFVGKRIINHAVASDSALPPERVSYNIYSKMRFSARPMSGVALVLMGFVEDLQSQWGEGLS